LVLERKARGSAVKGDGLGEAGGILSLRLDESGEPLFGSAEKRTFGELLHNELHNGRGAGRIVEIVRKIITVRWPRG
jgi:hypothetical protein